MNEQNWLVDQAPSADATNYSEGHKDKHPNNEVPLPAWPLFILIPIVVYYAAWKHSRQR